nr:MAG: putative tail fiber [Bacteriophage sp.]
MPQLKGVIKTPTGEPLGGATITLTSLHNRAGILKSVFSHVTTQNGEYDFPVLPGVYSVRLTQSTQRLSEIGVIRVYEDSTDGSLNDFLGATDIDLRPEALKKFEELAQQAQQSAEAAAESERQAGQHVADAQQIKSDCETLADNVQQNAEAVAEDKKQVEILASQIEDTASKVRQDAEAARKAASDAEQARDEIDTALSATLKTANHLSEIAAEGKEAQQESRDNLGLKSAATMEPQSDIYDRTEGRLAVPGMFGFGKIFSYSDRTEFETEADFLLWVKRANPGRYTVYARTNVVIQGVLFSGTVDIIWPEYQHNPNPVYVAKIIIFYGINGHVYYNRYWTASGGYLVGWENLKVNEASLRALIETRAPLNSPALTGTPTAPTPPDDAAGTEIANAAFVRKLLAALVDSSPEALDTLNELAAALGNDPNFATTVTNALAGKQPLSDVLTALSNLTQRADTLPYFNTDEYVSLAPLSEKGRSLLAQETPEAMRTVLELKSAATMEPQSDIYDRTEGRLAIPGALGFGEIFHINDRISFDTRAEFDSWIRGAKPGRYLVHANHSIVIPKVLFSGILEIIWASDLTTTTNGVRKIYFFYGVNGEVYYARGTSGIPAWELWRRTDKELIDFLSGTVYSDGLNASPEAGGIVQAAFRYQDKPGGYTLKRGDALSGSLLKPYIITVDESGEQTLHIKEEHTFPGYYWSLTSYPWLKTSDYILGIFIRYR